MTSKRFVIKVDHLEMYVRTEIDSSGMDAFWVARYLADEFNDPIDAGIMVNRLQERFPHRKFELEPL